MNNKWISVKNKKNRPPFNKNVLGYSNKGRIDITFTQIDGEFDDVNFSEDEDITHWQPLPNPPDEEDFRLQCSPTI